MVPLYGYKDFIFVTKKGFPITQESMIRLLKLIIKKANVWEQLRAEAENREPVVVPVHTPHYWRHTFTTRLVEKQVPYESLKVLLEHSSIKTSIDVYTHISQHNLKRVRTDVNGLINIF